jgi:hypothetical protein
MPSDATATTPSSAQKIPASPRIARSPGEAESVAQSMAGVNVHRATST